MRPDERAELAAEYALGTLPGDERRAADELMKNDPEFAAEVRNWERRLLPLAAEVPTVMPRPELRARILEAIDPPGQIIALRRQVTRWRGLAAAATALAACLAAAVIWTAQPQPSGRYVAVLQPEGQGAAFLASVDVANGTISVRRVQAEPQAGKSFELWAVGDGRSEPESLGLIDEGLSRAVRLTPGTILAVSLEPAGGSPTGAPTGPVLYTGSLVKTE
jgi:anti-sigma-K factor RskA